MVICKFFPNCRYGNSCKFEHVYPSSQFSRGNNQQYFGHHNYYQQANKSHGSQKHAGNATDLSEVMRTVVQEITQAEKGGQWPLSCFSPMKERQCFPGMLDYSQEEIRWKMYEAIKNGTLAECQRQIKDLYEAAKQKRNYLKNPNSEIYTIIEKCYGHKIESNTANFSVDGAKTPNKFAFGAQAFGNSQQNVQSPVGNTNFKFSLPQLQSGNMMLPQQSILGGGSNLQTSPMTGNQSSIFGGMGTSSATTQGFGSVQQNVPSQSTFVRPDTVSSFTGNVFGGTEATQPLSSNVFGVGGAAQPPMNPVFSSVGIAQTPPVSNVFAGGSTIEGSSLGMFGQGNLTSPASNKIFGGSDAASMATNNLFGRSDPVSSSSGFGTMGNEITSSDSVFGGASTVPASTNVFGQNSGFTSSVNKSQSSALDCTLYTAKEELNQDELLAFSANTFTLGKVPTRPPPKELCY